MLLLEYLWLSFVDSFIKECFLFISVLKLLFKDLLILVSGYSVFSDWYLDFLSGLKDKG